MYPENPEGTQVIVGLMNMEYISDTARNRTHNLFRPKREPIPLGHSDGHYIHILDLKNVKINSKIKFVSTVQPEIRKVVQKCLTLIFKVMRWR